MHKKGLFVFPKLGSVEQEAARDGADVPEEHRQENSKPFRTAGRRFRLARTCL